MVEMQLLYNYLVVGALLFGIGLIGFLSRRNMIIMFLAAEMMLQGVSLSLVAWSHFHNDLGGQVLVVFIIAIAACEAAIALALVLVMFERRGNLDIAAWHSLREANQAPFEDTPMASDPSDEPKKWPHLAPAGIVPGPEPEQELYRGKI